MELCICQVFASAKKTGAYLYVEKKQGLSNVPKPLLALLGDCRPVMVLLLQKDKKLAFAEACDVLLAIKEQGFYLQMPAQQDDDMQAIAVLNTKLER